MWLKSSLRASVLVLQGRSTRIKTGQAIDDVIQTRGAAGMPPEKF